MAYNILVIDDSSALRKVLIKAIKMCNLGNMEFFQAEHGEEALNLLKNQWIDVIFTDINMPVMDGITLMKELKKSEMKIPIIVVTSETRSQEIIHFGELGAEGVIAKPFRPEVIKKFLVNILESEGSTNEETDTQGFDF